MGYDWNRSGDVTLREGVTLETIVNAFYDQWDEERRYDPASLLSEIHYELCDDISITLVGRDLSYSADSNSGALDDAFGAFLDVVAERYAASGWADHYGEDEPDFMGPTPAAIRLAKLDHYNGVIDHATAAIKATLRECAAEATAQLPALETAEV